MIFNFATTISFFRAMANMDNGITVPLNFGLVFIIPEQGCQTEIDLDHRQQLPIPGPSCHSPVLTGTHLLAIGIHRTGYQDLLKFPDKLLGQRLHHMIEDVVDARDTL